MNELSLFQNTEFGEVRAIEINGEPWFVASDVCKALGIVNSTQAVQRLDVDERSMFNIGRQGEANIVNEYGLYNLVMASRKESAKQFKRWITHEVIPQIRKTGSYSVVAENTTGLSTNLQFMKSIVAEMERAEIEQQRQAEQLNHQAKQINHIEERVDTMREIMTSPIADWRSEINAKVREIAKRSGKEYQTLFTEMYAELEQIAHCSLKSLQTRKKGRMEKAGNTKTAIAAETTKIAIIEEKPQLKAIFEGIVRKYAMAYCA